MDNQKSLFLGFNREDQKAALEALIFASDKPLSAKALFDLLIGGVPKNGSANGNGRKNGNGSEESRVDEKVSENFTETRNFSDPSTFEEMIDEINVSLAATGRPFHIVKVAGGYTFATRPEYGDLIYRLMKSGASRRLSRAALETLAVIAYRQPVTKPEIESIRGVNSNEVVNALADKGLAKIVGRKDTLGKPLLYATTDEFLKVFGINNLDELPKLREIEEIADVESKAESIEIVVSDSGRIDRAREEDSGVDDYISVEDLVKP